MAPPLSPWTTYVAGLTPYIQRNDLMAWQRALNGIFGGAITLRSLVVDGTGGSGYNGPDAAANGPSVAGTIKVSATGTGTTLPTATIAPGTAYKASLPIAHALIDSTGALVRGFNIQAEPGALLGGRHPSAGFYVIQTNVAVSNPTECVAVASPKGDGSGLIYSAHTKCGTDGGFLSVDVSIYRHDREPATAYAKYPVPYDAEFSVVIFGE